jgi:hypothetical protein
MFLADFSTQEPKKESELKRWGRAGALMATGGLVVPMGGYLGIAGGLKLADKFSGKTKTNEKFDKLDRKIGSKYKIQYDDGSIGEIRRGSHVDSDVLLPRHKKALSKGRKLLDQAKLKNKKLSPIGAIGGALTGGALAGAGAYGVYRGGKALVNKLRGKKEVKK